MFLYAWNCQARDSLNRGYAVSGLRHTLIRQCRRGVDRKTRVDGFFSSGSNDLVAKPHTVGDYSRVGLKVLAEGRDPVDEMDGLTMPREKIE